MTNTIINPFKLVNNGSVSNPIFINNHKEIILDNYFDNENYSSELHLKVNNIIDITFIENPHIQIKGFKIFIYSDSEELIFEKFRIKHVQKDKKPSLHYLSAIELKIEKPVKDITNLLDTKLSFYDLKQQRIYIKKNEINKFKIKNTYNLNYNLSFQPQGSKFNISISEKVDFANGPENYSYTLEDLNDNEYLILELIKDYNEPQKNYSLRDTLYNDLKLNVKIPFFPIEFFEQEVKVHFNIHYDYNFIPYLYIAQSTVTLTTEKELLINLIFSASKIKINKDENKKIFFICHFRDTYSFQNMQGKNNVEGIIQRYELNQIPFSVLKINQYPNLLAPFFTKMINFKIPIFLFINYLILTIIIGAITFNQKDMAPSDSVSNQTYLLDIMKKQHADLNVESNEGWSYSDGYTQFNPLLYSIDLNIPVLNLGQSSSWIPIFDDKRTIVDTYYYFIKINSKIIWSLILLKLLKLWDKKNEE